MSEEGFVELELKWLGELRFDLHIRGTHQFIVDDTEGTDVAPSPVDLLLGAVSSCLASSFTFCVGKVRAELNGLKVTANAEISRVEGYLRVTNIDVNLYPQFKEEEDLKKKEDRCISIFRNYCTITESVVRGVPVNVSVKT